MLNKFIFLNLSIPEVTTSIFLRSKGGRGKDGRVLSTALLKTGIHFTFLEI